MAATARVIWLCACVGNFSCFQQWVGLENKNSQQHKDNSLKQLKTANPKSPAYIREGFLSCPFSPRGIIFVLFLLFFLWWGSRGGGGGRRVGADCRIFTAYHFQWEVIPAFRNPGKTPGARFSEFPKSIRARKAIRKIFLETLCL